MIIFTENGKPVFISFGNEYEVASHVATFSILLNKAEISWTSEDQALFFQNQGKKILFHKANSLWFVLITFNDLPVMFMRKNLEILADLFFMKISLHY